MTFNFPACKSSVAVYDINGFSYRPSPHSFSGDQSINHTQFLNLFLNVKSDKNASLLSAETSARLSKIKVYSIGQFAARFAEINKGFRGR